MWAREDKLLPPAHAERLANHFENTELVWITDSRTLIPIDQPEILTAHLVKFSSNTHAKDRAAILSWRWPDHEYMRPHTLSRCETESHLQMESALFG